MEKIKIGGELFSVYGRVASAEQIYDYTNGSSQERINSIVLNKIFSFNFNLAILSSVYGIETDINVVEYKEKGKTIPCKVSWRIERENGFVLDRETSDKGVEFEIINENSTIVQPGTELRWEKEGTTELNAGPGMTTVTMTLEMKDGISNTESKSFWVVPPIYYGFSESSELSEITFTNKKVDISPNGRYTLINNEIKDSESGINLPAYFYICIPSVLGVNKIEITSSGFRVPLEKLSNTVSTDLDIYTCWRNPVGSQVMGGSEVIYDVIVRD